VALGAWGVEWHDREAFESSFVYPPDAAPTTFARCLMSVDTSNLLLPGRDGLMATAEAGASLRVMGTAFATGQAAGVAAACHAGGGHLEAAEVRKVLAAKALCWIRADMPPPAGNREQRSFVQSVRRTVIIAGFPPPHGPLRCASGPP